MTVGDVDLDVDSDNDNAAAPDRSAAEELVEQDLPGKVVVLNDADRDNDGIVDLADGFNRDGTAGNADDVSTGATFVPMVISVPSWVNLSTARIRLTYDASDPAALQSVGDQWTPAYAPAPGTLRVWTLDADETAHRSAAAANATSSPGSYVPSGEYTPAQLGITASQRTVTLYVEAVRSAETPEQKQVKLELSPAQVNDAPRYLFSDMIVVTPLQDFAPDAAMSGSARLADGSVQLSSTDLKTLGFGTPWGNTRGYGGGKDLLGAGLIGNGWDVADLPRLIQGSSTIFAVDGGAARYFDKDKTGTYRERFGGLDHLVSYGGAYTLTDSSGNQTIYNDKGTFTSFTDPGGNVSTADLDPQMGKVTKVTHGTNTFEYAYIPDTDEDNKGLLSSVTWKNSKGTGANHIVRTATFGYYSKNDGEEASGTSFKGNLSDLKTVKISDAAAATLETWYYRYAKKSDESDPSRLTYAIGSSNYVRLNAVEEPTSADASLLDKYANQKFKYDANGNLTAAYAQGAGASGADGNAMGHSMFAAVTTNPADATGVNAWKYKSVETREDQSTVTTYMNYAGQVIGSQIVSGSHTWRSFTGYDKQNRETVEATPAAVTNLDASELDLVGRTDDHHSYANIVDSAGVLTLSEYYPESNPNLRGYLKEVRILQGDHGTQESGTDLKQQTLTYHGITDGGITIELPETSVVYADANATPLTTQYEYLADTHVQPTSVKITPPIVSTAQHGSGVAEPTTKAYDNFGRLTQITDPAGAVQSFLYDDETGLTKKTTIDATGAHPIVTEVTAWDALGRPMTIVSPLNMTTSIAYVDSATERKVTTTPGTGPVTIDQADLSAGTVEHWSTPPAGGAPVVVTRDYVDLGGRTTSEEVHPDSQTTYTTEYRYDVLGRQDQVKDAGGTFHKTTFDALGRPIELFIGDSSDPSTNTTSYQYDDQTDGDGNLTNVTLHTGETGTGAVSQRVTRIYYDWQDRLVATQQGVGASDAGAYYVRPVAACPHPSWRETSTLHRARSHELTDPMSRPQTGPSARQNREPL